MCVWKSIGIATALSLLIAVFGYLPSSSAEEGKNVKQMITEAKTPADHKAIAAVYREEGARLQKEASMLS